MALLRSPAQQAALNKLLADQQNPASSEYHHWLTSAEFGERFGLSLSDIAEIRTWLQSEGLRVEWVSPSRTFIGCSGGASDVGRAFRTNVNNYRVSGVDRFSVTSDPTIPAALAPAIKSIHGLYSIQERPMHQMSVAKTASPQATTSGGLHFIVPEDFQKIYDGAVSFTGTGQTIGIVGRSRTDFADFSNFSSVLNWGAPAPTEIVPIAFGGVDPGPALTNPPAAGAGFGDQGEATLDVLRAGSTAPGANLLLVVATDASGGIEADAQYLVETTPLPAQIMTISFGACESETGPTGVSYWDTLFEQAAAEGMSVFVSSGDSGAAGCDVPFAAPPASPAGNSPNYICSSSYATCVGGTEFNDAANPTKYWSGSNDAHLGSALGYIPEGGWNEPMSGAATQVASSGGGVSSYIATPSWQTGTGVPSARAGRYTPDISFSSSCHDGYFACFAAGGGNCVPASNGAFTFVAFCGTSAAAPSMAGVAALLDEKQGFAQGNLNPEIYTLASSAPASLHDATVSTSGVTNCTVNTPSLCNNSIPGRTSLNGGEAGYLLTDGYDLVTGLGSVDVSKFLNSFSNPYIAPTVTVIPSESSIAATQPLPVTIAVSAATGSPMPTGSVTLTALNYTSPSTVLSNGGATITIPAASLYWSIDEVAVTAKYTPDDGSVSTYRTDAGSANIVVNPLIPSLSVSLSSSNITTAQDLTVSIQASGGTGNPVVTGQIAVTAFFPPGLGLYSTNGMLSGGSITLTIPAGVLPPGTSSISAQYVPDAKSGQFYEQTFSASSPDVTVTAGPKTTPTVSVTPSDSSITTAQPLNVSVAVKPAAGNPVPTGTITLSSGAYTALPATLAAGGATFSIPGGILPVGVNAITALYSGDNNFNTTSGSSTVTVTALVKTTPNITLTPAASSISTAQSLDVTALVTVPTGYPLPTGGLIVSSGTYSTPLYENGSTWTTTIPGGSLARGNDTLTATYSPDQSSANVYNTATATASVSVVAATFSMSAGSVTVNPGGSSSSTVTLSTSNAYVGTVTLTCAVTSHPAGASDIPTCAASQTVSLSSAVSSATGTVTVSTIAASSAMASPAIRKGGWTGAATGAMVALILFGLPRRRRFLDSLLVFALLVLSGGLVACGGGGAGSGTRVMNLGTTPGAYTITVTGTGNDSAKTIATTSFTLTVN